MATEAAASWRAGFCLPLKRTPQNSEATRTGMGLLSTKRSAGSLFAMWPLIEQAYMLLYRNLDLRMAATGVSQSQASALLGLKAVGHALPLSSIGSLRALQAASVTAGGPARGARPRAKS